MSLLNIISSNLLKIENEISRITFYQQELSRNNIDMAAFIAHLNPIVEKLSMLIDALTSMLTNVPFPSMFRNIEEFCNILLERVKGQVTRLEELLTRAEIPKRDLDNTLLRISSELNSLHSRVCLNYETVMAMYHGSESRSQCYEKVIQAIKTLPIIRFDEDLSMYNERGDFAITLSGDIHATMNRKLLSFPGIAAFISTLTDTDRRSRVVSELKNYDINSPNAILPLSNELSDLFKCEESLGIWGLSGNLKEHFASFFSEGGWLEAYTYLMVERAGCSSRLLNAVIRNAEGVSIEADVLTLYRGNLVLFECKDRIGELSESDIAELSDFLTRTRTIEINKIIFIINSQGDHEHIRSQILTLSEEKAVNAEVIFLEKERLDNLDSKIRRGLTIE